MMANLVFTIAVLTAAAGPIFQGSTIDGQPVAGRIVAWEHDRLVLESEGGRVDLPVSRLLRIAAESPPVAPLVRPRAWVELSDGSLLLATEFEVTSGSARITLVADGDVRLPAAQIRQVRFSALTDKTTAQWNEIPRPTAGDLIIVRRGESLDFIEGTLHDISDETIKFELDGDVLSVRHEKVFGVSYYHPDAAELPATVAVVSDASGSRFAAASLGVEGDVLRITTVSGLKVSRPLETVAELDFSQGKIVYLSDLDWDPARSRWSSYIEPSKVSPALKKFYRPRRDRGFDTPTLRLGRRTYAKGLAVQSRTELVYRLPQGFSRFEALVGIDDARGEAGHVRLSIYGDRKELFSSEIRGGEAPLPLSLEIAGVGQLRILVDFADDLDVADCLNLCEARILR